MDFYYKYYKKDRKLCASFWKSGIHIQLYYVEGFKYVISKNRKVIYETYTLSVAEDHFFKAIYMEATEPELFTD